MSTFVIKTNDTRPALEVICSTDDGVVDFTLASSVKLVLKEKGAEGELVFKNTAAFVSPRTAGGLKYNWAAEDTEIAGKYEAEFEVTWATGDVQTFPTVGVIPVAMVEDAG